MSLSPREANHPCCSSAPSLSFPIYRVGMNSMPTSGHPLSHPLLALALRSRQGRQLPPSLCSPAFCHSGRTLSHAHFLGLLSCKLSAAPAWLGRPGPPPGPWEPSRPLEGVPPAVRGGAAERSCPSLGAA